MSSSRLAAFAVGAALLVQASTGCGGLLEVPGDDPSGSGIGTAGDPKPGGRPGKPGSSFPGGEPSKPPGTEPNAPGVDAGAALGDPGCPNNTSFDAGQLDTLIGGPYKAPSPPTASCSEVDIITLEANLAAGKSFDALKVGLSDACESCVFTSASAATWGPIVTVSNGASFGNAGACHAFVNRSVECGKAVQNHKFCTRPACVACSAKAIGSCVSKIRTGVCSETYGAVKAACPDLAKSTVECGLAIDTLVPAEGDLVGNALFFCASGS